ncbi:hypothetical protein C1E23_16055 [Pseudoalteromonas phenolica]|uniref:Uncharacterized protein TP-0789 domain-containing protein n=1 Tax=Pseudoalteromonas phenolica TaxID=161398 RepID=A0A4V2EJF1_9GAMM|nr:outer membrane lipoprotein-sorting protein [Pseudoalteromonas phenolica]RZQ52128.1 hypothetical protein C1E23_16055 [Pseudoalteromonas phenolica]
MKFNYSIGIFFILSSLISSHTVNAQNNDTKAYEILEAVKFREDGQTRQSRFSMTLTSKSGFKRSREITLLEQDEGADLKSLIYIHKPAEVQGTGVMLHAYDETSAKQDDIWLYIPAMRKTKRLSAKNKRGRFVSSELTYADLERLQLQDFTFKVEGEEQLDGIKVTKISGQIANDEAKFKTGYSKKVLWVDTQRHIFLKEVYYDEHGLLLKTRVANSIKQIESFWTITHLTVNNHQTGDKTELVLDDIKYNKSFSNSQFSLVSLKRGL